MALLVNVEFLLGSAILAQREAYVLMPSVILSQALVLSHLALHVSSDKRSGRSFPLQVSSWGKETSNSLGCYTGILGLFLHIFFACENLQKPLATIRVPPLPIMDHHCCGTRKWAA